MYNIRMIFSEIISLEYAKNYQKKIQKVITENITSSVERDSSHMMHEWSSHRPLEIEKLFKKHLYSIEFSYNVLLAPRAWLGFTEHTDTKYSAVQ